MAIQLSSIAAQFQGLNPNDVGRWPEAPKWASMFLVIAVLLGLGWYLYLDGKLTQLEDAKQAEDKHKQEYKARLLKAINLEALKKQKVEVSEYVNQMERQLPSKAEMDQLLSEINRAGIARGLQFDLFKPGNVRIDAYYAELPIAVKVTGTYHRVAGFAADLAALPRIVTLNNIALSPINNTNIMTFETTAKTFRYLDPEEVAAQKKAKEGVKK